MHTRLNDPRNAKVAVILAAAGSGERLAAGVPKAFAPLCGEPLLAHALRGIFGCTQVRHVIIVSPRSHVEQCREVADRSLDVDAAGGDGGSDGDSSHGDSSDGDSSDGDISNGGGPRVDVVVGGATRSASVQAGLKALLRDDGIVLVHDVARCLAPPELFARVIAGVRTGEAGVVPGLPVTDTVKVVDAQGRVLDTPDRESLCGIQTPQGFLREVLERAHSGGPTATDDAGLVERSGEKVRVVAGDGLAMKVTTRVDLVVATALLGGSFHAR